jgi:hypothetical protein
MKVSDATRSGWSTPAMRPMPPDHDRQTMCARSMPSTSRMASASSVRSVKE